MSSTNLIIRKKSVKILLIYSENDVPFPTSSELENEFKCEHVGDLNETRYDVSEESKWSQVDAELLYDFAFSFIKMNSAQINNIWGFDTQETHADGNLKVYLISDDVDRKYVDWWSLKHNFSLRFIDITTEELRTTLELSDTSSAVSSAHSYHSAVKSRERIFKYHKSNLTNSEISYFENLSSQEKKIKDKFNKICERLDKKTKRILTKKKW